MNVLLLVDFKQIFNDFIVVASQKVPALVTGILVILVCIVAGKLIGRIIHLSLEKRWDDRIVSNFISEAVKWSFYILGIISALNLLGFGGIASGLIAGAGISAIVFGFAFKDIGENFLSGIILAFKRPFEIGDIIEVDGFKGTVKDLDVRMTHLRNVEGKDIYIPNSAILKNSLINYTKDGYLRVSFVVGVAPESELEEVRSIILAYLTKNELILKSPEPKVLISELGEFTVDLQVFFWVDILVTKSLPDAYLGDNIRSKVIGDVKRLLDENNIEMPSQILEHKMYRDHSLRTSISEKGISQS
ncbi:MAG: mechanosensitive ion channel family protein [Saprospiraceae bacterium]|nr:mechanosensitive ion channel family protein [Saprospiraceae bacterium]